MFEYHGWAVVRQSTSEEDDGRLHEIVERLRHVIGAFNDGSGVADVRWINGEAMSGLPDARITGTIACSNCFPG